jgi:hypothetical protein
MIARTFLRGAAGVTPKARLERLLAGPPIDGRADLPAVTNHGEGLAEALALLGGVSALTVLFTAGGVIGPGFRFSDIVVLVAAQLTAVALIWRFSWHGVNERWLLALVGAQALFVASVITVTGGGSSPYLAFYAPVLAIAGWHLRSAHAAIAVAIVVTTELWRTLVAPVQSDLTQLAVSLPAFGPPPLSRRCDSSATRTRPHRPRTMRRSPPTCSAAMPQSRPGGIRPTELRCTAARSPAAETTSRSPSVPRAAPTARFASVGRSRSRRANGGWRPSWPTPSVVPWSSASWPRGCAPIRIATR